MSPRIWLKAAFRNGIPRRSFIVALVVGPILTMINQGDRLVAGEGLNWAKVVLTFMVPYAVATVGALGARQSQNKKSANSTLKPACQPDAAPLRSAPNPSAETGAPPMKARVHVTLKSGVLDPQGKAIENALSALGFAGVENVRQGKVIEFSLDEGDPDKALASVEIMCEKLLANTVIENYAIDLES
jgi:phosphoribosylformylglycinamidine synthase